MAFFKILNYTRRHEVFTCLDNLPPIEYLRKIISDYGWSETEKIISTDYVKVYKLSNGKWTYSDNILFSEEANNVKWRQSLVKI
jgi:hypothetical protein